MAPPRLKNPEQTSRRGTVDLSRPAAGIYSHTRHSEIGKLYVHIFSMENSTGRSYWGTCNTLKHMTGEHRIPVRMKHNIPIYSDTGIDSP
jgi:hypothetical protein